jgi:CheY-like chemotaxis protein
MREGGLDETLIVALTGYGQEQDRQLTSEAGFDAHWVKPVDLSALHTLLVSGVRAPLTPTP